MLLRSFTIWYFTFYSYVEGSLAEVPLESRQFESSVSDVFVAVEKNAEHLALLVFLK